jgi:hypothetical protein
LGNNANSKKKKCKQKLNWQNFEITNLKEKTGTTNE